MVFRLLHPKVYEVVKKRFERPTLPQEVAIPKILEEKNVLLQAPVSTGKTEAAILPVLSKIVEKKLSPIAALYITPLRALNRDMLSRLLWWCEELGLEIAVRHGDTSVRERKLQAEFPTHLLILTPETLQAILPGKKMRKHLSNVRFVIIDELHELAESKRGTQLAVALERLREVSRGFKVIGLSATMGNLEEMAKLISPNEDIETLRVEFPKGFEVKVILPDEKPKKKYPEKLASSLSPSSLSRLECIDDLIKVSKGNVLVFTNTREFAEILSNRLKLLDASLKLEVHHSSLSRDVRMKVEREFKEGKLEAIVCTSSLELGIDIGSIEKVIQYSSPRQVTQAIQRIGRSGHALHKVSKGILIPVDEDDVFECAVIGKRVLEKRLEATRFHKNSLDVLSHQIVGILVEHGSMEAEKVYEIVRRSYPYKELRFQEFLWVCKFLEKIGLLWIRESPRRENSPPT